MVADPCLETSEEEKRRYQKLQEEKNRQADRVVRQLISSTEKRLIAWRKEGFSDVTYVTEWNDIEVKLTPDFSHSDFPGCHHLFSLHLDFSPPQEPFLFGIQGGLNPEYKFAPLGEQVEEITIKKRGPFGTLKKLYGLVAPVCENNWWLQSYGIQAKEILKRFNVKLEGGSSAKKIQKTIIKAVINEAKGMNWIKVGERCYQTQFNGMEISLLLFDDYIGMNLTSLEIKLRGEEFSVHIEGEIENGYSCTLVSFDIPIETKVFPGRKVGFYDDLRVLYYQIQKRVQKEERGEISGEIAGKTANLLAKLKI